MAKFVIEFQAVSDQAEAAVSSLSTIIEQMSGKVAALTGQLEAAGQKLANAFTGGKLSEAGDEAAKVTTELSELKTEATAAAEGLKEVTEAAQQEAAAMTAATEASETATDAVQAVGDQAAAAREELASVADTVTGATIPAVEDLADKVEDVQEKTDKTSQSTTILDRLLDKLGGKFKWVGDYAEMFGSKLAAALSIGAVALFTKRAVDAADDIGKFSQKLGVATEILSGWIYSARLANVQTGELSVGLKTLANLIVDAARGNQTARDSLDIVGVSATDTAGRVRSLADVVPQIADAFNRMPDGVLKTEAAIRLFGRAGEHMIPMLNAGANGLEKMAAEARAAGLEISGKTAAAAEAFNDNLTRLAGVMQGLGIMFAEGLLPHLQSFTEWLLKLQRESGVFSAAAETLTDVVVILSTAIDLLWMVLNSLATLLTAGVANALGVFGKGVQSAVVLTDLWLDSLKAVAETLLNLPARLAGVGKFMSQLARGDIEGAWESIRDKVNGVGEDAGKLVDRVKQNATAAAGVVTDFVSDSFATAEGVGKETISSLAKEWNEFFARVEARVTRHPAQPKTPSGNSSQELGPLPQEVEAARARLDEIETAYREAVLGRKRFLDQELATSIARLQTEADRRIITETEAFNAIEQLRILHSHAILEIEKEEEEQRKARERAEASARAGRDSAKLALERRLIETNPDLTRSEFKARMLSQMQDEIGYLQELIVLQEEARAKAANPEEQIEAERQKLELMIQQAEIAAQLRQLQEQDFTGTMRTGLRQLGEEWTNFGVNAAHVLINGVQRSVDAVSDSIMGLIDGTTTWGEAFANVARQIVADIIRIIVQWVAGKLIMIAMEKLFGATVATTTASNASQAAVAWAPAAVSASIASYGAAAAIGTTAYIGALASGTAVSAGISAGAGGMGFEMGGVIPAGERTIRVNEAGQEAVVNARGLRNLGAGWINAINAGAITAQDLEGNVTASINGAVPGFEESGMGRTATRTRSAGSAHNGGGEGGGSKVTVIVVDDRNRAEEMLFSTRGEVHIIGVVKNNKVEIGIPT